MGNETKAVGPEYITTSFIAERCGVSKITVLSWIKEERLRAFRLPKGHYRIRRDDFIEFLNTYGMHDGVSRDKGVINPRTGRKNV